jgi:putative restriction endonuclease
MSDRSVDSDRLRELLSRQEYVRDDRKFPDERRRGQFRSQWQLAVTLGPNSAATLRKLTWSNLGRRAGVAFGPADEMTINDAFDSFAAIYVQDKRR